MEGGRLRSRPSQNKARRLVLDAAGDVYPAFFVLPGACGNACPWLFFHTCMVRLQKFLAEAGVASRRASELIILEGRVAINGQVVRELGAKVSPGADTVSLDGKAIKTKSKLYVALNKPRGFLCTRQDEQGRRVIGELLPREWTNLYSVGRLDRESEGLIFLTNDGDFSLHLTHPRYGVRKRYVVGLAGTVPDDMAKRLTAGVEHEGEHLRAERSWVYSATKARSVVEVELTEGKNREVRRMFEALGMEVERLQRVQIGPIKLGDLKQGKWRTLNPVEVRSLMTSPVREKEPKDFVEWKTGELRKRIPVAPRRKTGYLTR